MLTPQTKYEVHEEIRGLIQMYINDWNFMGGEFELHIFQCHSATQALEYLRGISILSTLQRNIVSACYEELNAFDQRFPALTQPDANEIRELRFKFAPLWDIFEGYAKRRGLDPETHGLTSVSVSLVPLKRRIPSSPSSKSLLCMRMHAQLLQGYSNRVYEVKGNVN